MLRFSFATLVALICVAACTATVHADLSLDSTFASDGIAELDLDTGLDSARDIAAHGDGYVVAGLSRRTSGADTFDYATVTRFKDDGTPTRISGTRARRRCCRGGTTLSFGGGDARAIVVQPADQKIVVAGSWNVNDGSGYRVFVLRLLTDGSPDPDFGTEGVVILDLPGLSNAQAEDLALQSDGGHDRIGRQHVGREVTGDCSIKASDALTALKMAVGGLTPVQVADLDGNGHVTASDALGILRIAVGVDEPTGACNV
jgi:hypothetical protein